MTDQTSLRYWVDEAIQSLGYVKPEAAPKLCDLITHDPTLSYRSVSTAYRKSGTQLSTDEKKALGIRANAFMTKEALAELTDKGRANALGSHEITMRRAAFAHGHVREIAEAQRAGVSSWKVMAAPGECPGCQRLNDSNLSAGEILPTGPHDCAREACALVYLPKLRSALESAMQANAPVSSRPWWKFW